MLELKYFLSWKVAAPDIQIKLICRFNLIVMFSRWGVYFLVSIHALMLFSCNCSLLLNREFFYA
jgi:hypothetical protein